jgi:hypothetical protein
MITIGESNANNPRQRMQAGWNPGGPVNPHERMLSEGKKNGKMAKLQPPVGVKKRESRSDGKRVRETKMATIENDGQWLENEWKDGGRHAMLRQIHAPLES